MSVRGLRNGLLSIVPKWLSNRPALNSGFKILYVIALMGDCMIETALEGVRAAWPGRGTPTADPLIGQSRGIAQGEAESSASYEARLRAWLTTWQNAGSSEVLSQAIQSYLGNNPIVRIVDRSGNWVTANQDGTTTYLPAGTAAWVWNWDQLNNPERDGWWADLWIIVYPTEWSITGTTLSSLIGIWGTYTGVGTGHAVPRAAVDAILGLVAQWKGAHTWIEAIIYSYDATLFNPSTINAGNPDGTWAFWSKPSGNTRVVARNGSTNGKVRYWIPAAG
jgi:hypothetical protein